MGLLDILGLGNKSNEIKEFMEKEEQTKSSWQ